MALLLWSACAFCVLDDSFNGLERSTTLFNSNFKEVLKLNFFKWKIKVKIIYLIPLIQSHKRNWTCSTPEIALFTRLVFNLGREPAEATQVWLSGFGSRKWVIINFFFPFFTIFLINSFLLLNISLILFVSYNFLFFIFCTSIC